MIWCRLQIASLHTAAFAQHRWDRTGRDEANLLPLVSFASLPLGRMNVLTSVQTAVMSSGGVRSYSKQRGVTLGRRSGLISMLPLPLSGGTEKMSAPTPSSLFATPSNCTLSPNLYVSTHATTGTRCSLASMATMAVPAREYRAPSECSADAPRSTSEEREMRCAACVRRT